MNEGTRTGVTLGKFAPLHYGHQHLIEMARQQVDHLVILVYASSLTDIPLPKRAGWIRALYHGYPRVTVIECYDGPEETGRDPEVMKTQEEYVKRVLSEKGIVPTHFFSSEWYGEHMAKALNAENVVVDIERIHYKVSGAEIREEPFKWRRSIHPLVYKDLIKKIVFLGAESTGKSTLAEYMASKYATQFMREYGREYWERMNVDGKLTKTQLLNIATKHVEMEERLVNESNRFLFVDTNAITTYMFSVYYHGEVDPLLEELAKKAQTRYDLTCLCGDDIPYVEDGTRDGEEHRHRFQEMIIEDLNQRGVQYVTLKGNLQARMDMLDQYLKGV